MSGSRSQDAAYWIKSLIQEFLDQSADNSLQDKQHERAWDEAIIGFSSGADPLYQQYKQKYIGSFHWTPLEALETAFPESGARAEDLTVISWILPQREITKSDNRKQSFYPSEFWARARIYGEEVNKRLRQQVVQSLENKGFQAVAPQLSGQWTWLKTETFGYASTWSERHAAYAAGLGTFGLCDGLITSKGKAHRIGSVVARIHLPHSPRPYTDHHEYCLFFTQGSCKKCISRCPADAITELGKDKDKCYAHLFPKTSDYVKEHYGFDGYGCGLCQTKVPCESKIPTKQDLEG